MSFRRIFSALVIALTLGLPNLNGQLILTEFMANPSSLSDDFGEYFEVFNAGPTAIAVDGLTISDDGADSFTFAGTGLTIGAGEFFVFGDSENTDTPSYVDVAWGEGNYFISNGGDEIVVSDAGGELLRLNYTNGDPFGAGVAAVLDDIASDSSDEANFIAEVTSIGSNTGGTNPDLGSPGVAGATNISAIPEPASAGLIGLAAIAGIGFIRRRK